MQSFGMFFLLFITSFIISLITSVITSIPASQAGEAEAYQQAINLAAQQRDAEAIAALSALAEALPTRQTWQERAQAAQALLHIRMQHQENLNALGFAPKSQANQANPYLNLAHHYASSHPFTKPITTWPATLLASLFPGAGHAWLGRWNDASTAALMVWPILLLTLWAYRRGMGPVTVFFALITVGLWSGTVFSATSLAERGSLDAYMLWWQHIWQASGLPATRPW